jgi:diketogulonate reductase-like aldo/keto reductase
VRKIAAKHAGMTPAVVLLRWSLQVTACIDLWHLNAVSSPSDPVELQHGVAVIPRTSNLERIVANAPESVLGHKEWHLDTADMAALDSLGYEGNSRRFCWDSSKVI